MFNNNFLARKFDLHKNKAFNDFMNVLEKLKNRLKKQETKRDINEQSFVFELNFEFRSVSNKFKIVHKVIEKMGDRQKTNKEKEINREESPDKNNNNNDNNDKQDSNNESDSEES